MLSINTILLALITTCAAAVGILFALPNNLNKTYKVVSLSASGLLVIMTIYLCGTFEQTTTFFQYLAIFPWLSEMNIYASFGVDGVSLVFLALTTVLFPFCILASWKLPNAKFLMINLLLIEFFLLLTFTALDLFLFCVFFESLLIPMFFIILFWGARDRRIKALTYFFLYTLFGSIFLILALFLVFYEANSTSYFSLLAHNLTSNKQMVFWLLLFITFAIKIPMFPFHIWLPEAHVEAPTVGSVILAGLLLKLGAYGMLRFLFLFDYAKFSYEPYVLAICVVSILLASLIAIRQLDMKRIIAYSSIAHMNFALLGYFSNTVYGMMGGTLLMVSHGIVSSALFLLIGVLYDRYHTRSVLYYGGLATVMPLFAFFFFMFTISNFSFPGTSNFIGELVVLIGLGYAALKAVLIVGAVSTFFGLVYSILLYNRITFGNLKYTFINKFTDVNRREYGVLALLLVLNMIMGIVPGPVIAPISLSIESLVYSTMGFMLEDVSWMDLFYFFINKGKFYFTDIAQYGKDAELYARFWVLAADPHYNAHMFFQLLISEGKISATCSFEDDFIPVLYSSFLEWVKLCRETFSEFSIAQYMEGYACIYRHLEQFKLSHPEDWHHVYPFLYLWHIMESLPDKTLWDVYADLVVIVDNKNATFTFTEFVNLSDKSFQHYIVDHMQYKEGTVERIHQAMHAYGVDPEQCSVKTDVTKSEVLRFLKHPKV